LKLLLSGLHRRPTIEAAKVLLRHGAMINARYASLTPLHSCAAINDTKLAALLLEYGADINAQDDNKSTPLHLAVRHGMN
jgi:ankyrin repeat protein